MNRDDGALWFFMGFMSGLTVGALMALLTTPYTGRDVRERIVKGGGAVKERLRKLRRKVEEEPEEVLEAEE